MPTLVEPLHLTFLHGQPGTGSDWSAVIDQLPDSIRAFAPDRPGYRSNPRAPGDFAANARFVLAELDAADIAETVLVGHSYGGGVALTIAAMAPERVRAVVLVSSVGPRCLNGWDTLLAAPVTGPVCSICAWWLTPWFARARLGRIARRRGRALAPDEYVYWDIWANARHSNGAMWRTFLVEQRALVADLDALVALIPSVHAPTLIVADPKDTIVPVATAHALHELLPESELYLINGGGHQLPRRNAIAVSDSMTRFLDRIGALDHERSAIKGAVAP
jgi:pimeloyl-ACP methyl ester carboxylesterase